MIKRFAFALLASSVIGVSALANGFDAEVGYSYVNLDDDGIDVDLGALYGFAGYRWDFDNGLSGTAEGFLAFGVSDDNVGPVSVDLEPTFGAAYRLSRDLDNDFSIYGRAIFARFDAEASGVGLSDTADETGFGVAVGGAFKGFTLSYSHYFGDLDGVSAISLGYQFGN